MGFRKRTLDGLELTPEFWKNKRVLLTGHSGFKGGWMALWLQKLDARLSGYALEPPSQPSLFSLCRVADYMESRISDIRDPVTLGAAMDGFQPEIVIHLAAQSLVRHSFKDPVNTYATNVMGTVNVLEAVRRVSSVKAVVIVTSDKCYENRDRPWRYSEDEAMGGYDPYSSSKGCAELVTAAYRRSFFGERGSSAAVASARAGNVIGGGDWAEDRLIPDMMLAISEQRPVLIRNPGASRPWQHVLEPVHGYLTLAEKLYQSGEEFAEGWNFGPDEEDAQPVQVVVEKLIEIWGDGASWTRDRDAHPHEAHFLGLDCSKAKQELGWQPVLSLNDALQLTAHWYRSFQQGANMRQLTLEQISDYQNLVAQ